MHRAYRHSIQAIAVLAMVYSGQFVHAAEENIMGDERKELSTERSSLPAMLKIHVKRRDLGPGPGRIVEITDIRSNGGKVTARMTMNRPGADGCRLIRHNADGEYDGRVLTIKPIIEAGDYHTCTFGMTLSKGAAGWSGTAGTTMDAKEIQP